MHRHGRHAGARRHRPRGRAAATPLSLLALVVTHDGVAGVFCGDVTAARGLAAGGARSPRAATSCGWSNRSIACSSVMPPMYEDLWTAAKGVYKTEPAVADGGEVVIYAPHVSEVSHVHGTLIDEIGYHCRDYFLAQWDRFGGYPGRHPRALDAREGPGHLRRAARRRDARASGDAGDRHSRERCERINLGLSWIPPSVDLDGLVGRRSAAAPRGSARRRAAVPRRDAAGR